MTDESNKPPGGGPPHQDPDATLVVDGRRLWAALETVKPPSSPPGAALPDSASANVAAAEPARAPSELDQFDDAWESLDTSGPTTSRGQGMLAPLAPPAPLAAVTPPAPAVAAEVASTAEAKSFPPPAATSPADLEGVPFLDSDLLEEVTPSQSRIATARPPASESPPQPAVPSAPPLPSGLGPATGPAPSAFVTPLGFAQVVVPTEAKPPTAPPERPAPPPRRGPSAVEMEDRFSMGDFAGAMSIAEELLARDATHVDATDCLERSRAALRSGFATKLGPLDRVPVVAIPREQLRWLSIDHKAGFILSHVDGVSNLEEIIDISGMKELDALGILAELAEQRIIAFH